ncbi:Pisatin demethylase [Madurella fahalii]|uniref:Pisatin demethylase n=1 Tax=Madurella fahalii TaxID=1157608 RepID=A0ABQ0GPN3_9PEZI
MELLSVLVLAIVAIASALVLRIIYNLYFHPLARFPGPWYAASFSLSGAIVSLLRREPEWMMGLAKKYGAGDNPIRISPNLLLFPRSSTLKDIYCKAQLNTKGPLYGTGVLGPPHLFSTLDGNEHRILRKALGGPQWSFGVLKNVWEPRIDGLIELFSKRMMEFSERGETVDISDKVAQFAADVMTMVSFSEPWGFVKNSRDERHLLESWRDGLNLFGFAGRFRWFRDTILKSPLLAPHILPKMSDASGMGYLIAQADEQVARREKLIDEQGFTQDKPDFLQYALEARIQSQPLSPVQKRAHITLLIQAGADTTGTALGSTLRFLLTHPSCLARVRSEIAAAEAAGRLSSPVQYEETRAYLPYFVACIKESMRLNPPATNLFSRLVPEGGARVGGVFVPEGTEITTQAWVVMRDPELYAPDPEAYRPERWLESEEKTAEFESCSFVFGMGPRVCLGKDIAVMELYKLLPEILRRFDMELVSEGRPIVAGGVMYNSGLTVRLSGRKA